VESLRSSGSPPQFAENRKIVSEYKASPARSVVVGNAGQFASRGKRCVFAVQPPF